MGDFDITPPGGTSGGGAVDSVNGHVGTVVLTAANIDSAVSPINYSAATADIDAHLAGIDTALGTVPTGEPADMDDIRDQIMYLMFRDDAGYSPVPGMMFDTFTDESGINTSASTNEDYDSSADSYSPTTNITDMGTGTLTATSARGLNSSNGLIGGLKFTTSSAGTITSVVWTATTVTTSGSGHIELWTDSSGSPGTQVGGDSDAITISATGTKTFTWSSNAPELSASTTYWCVLQMASGSIVFATLANEASFGSGRTSAIASLTDTQIGGLGEDWFASVNVNTGASNMTLISTTSTADDEPDIARCSAFIEPVDTVTINTDLIMSVSRDGGTTWDAATLAKVADLGDTDQYAAEVTLTSTGTTMCWKIATANNKDLIVHAAGISWRDS